MINTTGETIGARTAYQPGHMSSLVFVEFVFLNVYRGNCIGGIIVIVLTSSVVDRGFEHDQVKL